METRAVARCVARNRPELPCPPWFGTDGVAVQAQQPIRRTAVTPFRLAIRHGPATHHPTLDGPRGFVGRGLRRAAAHHNALRLPARTESPGRRGFSIKCTLVYAAKNPSRL
jgi:hypothetical protein